MKIPISILRKLCIRVIIYLDDLLLMGTSLKELLIARDTLIYLLHCLDFLFSIGIEPKIDFEIFRSGSEFSRHDIESLKRGNVENSGTKQINQQTSFHSSSNYASTTAIQGFAIHDIESCDEFSGQKSDSLRPSEKETKLVDLKSKSIQWKIFDNSPSSDNYKLRCLEYRLGSSY